MYDKCTPETEIELEKELEIDIDKKKKKGKLAFSKNHGNNEKHEII